MLADRLHEAKADDRALPHSRPNAFVSPGAEILRDEGVRVAHDPQRKAHDEKAEHAGGQRGGHRVDRVPHEKHAVDKVVHRPRARRNNQRQREQQHLPHAVGPFPPDL
jgi:hypothetical protein